MSEPIKVGDLVQIVKWAPCGCGLGVIGLVTRIWSARAMKCCLECKRDYDLGTFVPITVGGVGGWGVPMPWVKRIPPLSELEGEKRKEEIEA